MLLMRISVDDDVINVYENVLDACQHVFHEALERGRATQEAHGRSYPFKLTSSFDSEGGETAIGGLNGHLPESRGEVDGAEDGGSGAADVGDAFRDVLHGVFVHLCLGIEGPEVLHDSEALPCFLRDTKNRGVV